MATPSQRQTKSGRGTRRPREGASSPVLWVLWVLWTLAIIYGSLWPWQAWRDIGTAPWSFLNDPLPRYWTWFDLFSNVALYIPLGLLLAMNLGSWRRSNLWVPLLIGGLLSLSIEAAQSYLPQRVPSILDLAANMLGAFSGAVIAAAFRRPWYLLRRMSQHWWNQGAQWPAVLVILWLSIRIISLVQVHPEALGLQGRLPSAPESLTAGLGQAGGAGWLWIESLLVSLLLAQVCRKPAVFWLSLFTAQSLLIASFLYPIIQALPKGLIWLGIWPLVLWSLILVGWAVLHRRISPHTAHWAGLTIASLWALRSLIMVVFTSLASDAEQWGLGPGLGPSPPQTAGATAWLLAMQETWLAGLGQWRSVLSPFGQVLFDAWFGVLQADNPALNATPVLGRSLQHFEAVVLLVQALWRWLCLIWFFLLCMLPRATRLRPQRRL